MPMLSVIKKEKMTEELKKYESSINKKFSFGWTPEYEEEFRTNLNKTVFFPITKEVVEKLGWELVYEDESSIEIRKNAEGFHWGQKIVIDYQSGKIKINSKSIQSPLFDFGRNSKRVKLFIYAFKELEKNYDKEALTELEEKVNSTNNWDDYEIPDVLPQPEKQVEPKTWIPIIGGIILSIILGFIVAFLTIKFIYVIGLYEVVIGFLIGFGFKYLIKLSNYTNFNKLSYLLVGVVLIIYILNQYFLYGLIMSENNIEPIGFLNFIQMRFEEGLTIKSMNTGWIGLVISWIFQIGLTYGIAYNQLASNLTQYQLEKIPMEVVNFAFYHLVKGKDENEVRKELTKMGWSKEEDQNDVFESIGAIQSMQELNRMD
jgi:hypothetical protein